MFATTTSIRDTATAIAASLLCTTLAVAVSASPARAADRGITSAVARSIASANAPSTERGVATVFVTVAASGKVQDARVIGSTGCAVLDADAVEAATTAAYPRGNSIRRVAVVMTYNGAPAPTAERTAALVARARAEALAASSPAPNAG